MAAISKWQQKILFFSILRFQKEVACPNLVINTHYSHYAHDCIAKIALK
jgi:hypothetical protein